MQAHGQRLPHAENRLSRERIKAPRAAREKIGDAARHQSPNLRITRRAEHLSIRRRNRAVSRKAASLVHRDLPFRFHFTVFSRACKVDIPGNLC